MAAYYNEFDPFAAAWLKELIKAGHIADGEVDTRSITDVRPDELIGFTQCHFFAGIGGWSYALRLAGWPDDRPVWTGSCPCQPFSSAGKQKGKSDERHLWPVWFNLIRECRPATVFGEQVSSAIAHGWLDDVYQGLEQEGYACGSAVLPACSVGAPHKRDRLWFVANAQSARSGGTFGPSCETSGRPTTGNGMQPWRTGHECGDVANAQNINSHERGRNYDLGAGRGNEGTVRADGGVLDVGDSEHNGSHGRQIERSNGQAICDNAQGENSTCEFEGTGEPCNVADTELRGCERQQIIGCGELQQKMDEPREPQQPISAYGSEHGRWDGGIWIDCPDGKQRLVEPSVPLLAHGVRNRVGKLRGYGNAIVPQVAAKFIQATM